MAGAGKKTFTAGEILTASDTNTYLMEQTVMNFAGTAARASAIPTPSTGMTTYIGVTGTASIPQIETYTGSAWQTPYGLTQVANVSFTTVSSIQIDNVFTGTYDNYLFLYNLTATSTTNNAVRLRLVDGTTPLSAANYTYAANGQTSGGAGATLAGTGQTSMIFAYVDSTAADLSNGVLNVISPQKAQRTGFTLQTYNYNGVADFAYAGGGAYNTATQVEGIQFFPTAGTFSGTIRVYGYRNS
jgi:hypothetical protein